MRFPDAGMLTPHEASIQIAKRLKTLRLMQGWKRETLADRSGVTSASIKRFETEGEASLLNVLKIAHALGRLADVQAIFGPPPARSMTEFEQQAAKPVPKRGRR